MRQQKSEGRSQLTGSSKTDRYFLRMLMEWREKIWQPVGTDGLKKKLSLVLGFHTFWTFLKLLQSIIIIIGWDEDLINHFIEIVVTISCFNGVVYMLLININQIQLNTYTVID